LAEIGLDSADHQPVTLEALGPLDFDLAVTLSPEAHHRALELTRDTDIAVEYWPTPDPTAAFGSREQILAAYRELRELLAARLAAPSARPPPTSRSNPGRRPLRPRHSARASSSPPPTGGGGGCSPPASPNASGRRAAPEFTRSASCATRRHRLPAPPGARRPA